MHTKDRLAHELRSIGLTDMAELAEHGRYDDFLSSSATPLTDLVNALRRRGTAEALELAKRVMGGEFDATDEEAEAWAASPEGRETIAKVMRGM